jgi:guanylate kinase
MVVSGPSGAGKSTLCRDVLNEDPNLFFSVSCTTRARRSQEQDGIDYHFIDATEFERRIERADFIEYARVHGNFYGTLRSEVMDRIHRGEDVLLDIDVQGALQIRNRTKTDPVLAACAEFVFISPPNLIELERRLRERGTESEEVIRIRLGNARSEMAAWHHYDNLVVNHEVDHAVADLAALVRAFRMKTNRMRGVEP